MRKSIVAGLLALCLSGIAIIVVSVSNNRSNKPSETPNEWFFLQRSFPYAEINYTAREEAWQQAGKMAVESPLRGEGWVVEGPYNTGGRISAIAIHPTDMQTFYAGAASGGIFKTTNAGQTWTPVFEDALSLSIGDIAIAPSNPEMVWVGTGEANAGGGSMTYDGNGVYVSSDGGASWQHTGLDNCGNIGRLAIHPGDPQTCYVAAMGRLFSDNPERGVFRTTNGGETWDRVLFLNDSVGAIDIVIHPDHPDTLYAAMWERIRRPDRRDYGGPGSGIYRSYDGGDTWTLLSSGLPAASASVGRIGIDISASDPDVLYAIYADHIGYFDGVYRTNNGGNSWFRTNDSDLDGMYASYGWWFGRISIDPVNPEVAYAIGFDLYKTTTGGNNWSMISSGVHVDQHDLAAHPMNPSFVVLGNDGGIYLSGDAGNSWDFINNLPITQFYTCEIDEQFPQRLYGGTQDNGTTRRLTAGGDWQMIYWGDGFHVLVDPVNNSYVYAEYQYGNFARSTNGGQTFTTAMNGISTSDRMNWNTPVIFDPVNPQILYYGANRLYKSVNRAQSWTVISPDLSNGSTGSSVVYGTITSIAVSPSDQDMLYAGTDDGNVWHSPDGGSNWINISDGLPVRWITRVVADPVQAQTVFVTLSGYRYDSYLPHIFRSEDAGTSWLDITGNLPDVPVNDLIVDPEYDSTLYIATDFGVFVTRNMGMQWSMLGDNLPNVPVTDLDLHQPSRSLIAATYGRSMYSFDLDQTVGVLDPQDQAGLLQVFPNPASGQLMMNYSGNNKAAFVVLDMQGRAVKSGEMLPASISRLEIEDILPGNYLIRVSNRQKIETARFIKR